MLLSLVVLSQPVLACTAAVDTNTIDARLHEAEERFAALDSESFLGELERITLDLPCLDGPLRPGTAARYHQLVGLRLFALGRREDARHAFAAARELDPLLSLQNLLPPGHAAIELANEPLPEAQTTLVHPLRGGTLYFDGSATLNRPQHRATLLQLDSEGSAPASWLLPGTPLPPYRHRAHPGRARRTALWTVGVLSLATGGTLAALAATTSDQVRNDTPADWTRQDVLDAQDKANSLALGSGIAAGVGVLAIGGAIAF